MFQIIPTSYLVEVTANIFKDNLIIFTTSLHNENYSSLFHVWLKSFVLLAIKSAQKRVNWVWTQWCNVGVNNYDPDDKITYISSQDCISIFHRFSSSSSLRRHKIYMKIFTFRQPVMWRIPEIPEFFNIITSKSNMKCTKPDVVHLETDEDHRQFRHVSCSVESLIGFCYRSFGLFYIFAVSSKFALALSDHCQVKQKKKSCLKRS